MAETPEIITSNQPFDSLRPLNDYLVALDDITQVPSEQTIARVQQTDRVLTSRAVLYPASHYEPGEGYRIDGYQSCTVSDGVTAIARLARHEPGSVAFIEEYNAQFSRPGALHITFDNGVPTNVSMDRIPVPPDEMRTDIGSPESRRNAARSALISLGGSLAVSGAFVTSEIKPAYTAIRASLELFGHESSVADFAAFGLKRIAHGLLNKEWYLQHRSGPQNPISKGEAAKNIRAAWSVTGKPYGRFATLAAAFASRPNF